MTAKGESFCKIWSAMSALDAVTTSQLLRRLRCKPLRTFSSSLTNRICWPFSSSSFSFHRLAPLIGRRTWKVVPRPTAVSQVSEPACLSTTNERQIANPGPVPRPTSFVVKRRSNMRLCSARGCLRRCHRWKPARDQDSQVPPRRLFTNIRVFGQEAHRRSVNYSPDDGDLEN